MITVVLVPIQSSSLVSYYIIKWFLDGKIVSVNTGDSRSLLSKNGGKEIIALSNDHKPSKSSEMERIFKNKGHLYCNYSNISSVNNTQTLIAQNEDQFDFHNRKVNDA